MIAFLRNFCLVASSKRFMSLNANVHESYQTPLMRKEVLSYLSAKDDDIVLDMTFGTGGHSKTILDSCNAKVLALDRDPASHNLAKQLAEQYPERLVPLLGCFSDLPQLLQDHDVKCKSIDCVVLDPGCSSLQIQDANRGFCHDTDGPLDMRMDGNRLVNNLTAFDVLTRITDHDLHKIFKVYGQVESSKKIAAAIVSCRYNKTKLTTTSHLKEVIKLSGSNQSVKKVFRALRYFVNNELNELNYGLLVAEKYLKSSGRLVALVHSNQENIIVKRHIQGLVQNNHPTVESLRDLSKGYSLSSEEIEELRKSPWKSLTKHAIRPTELEKGQKSWTVPTLLRAAMKV